MQAHMCAHTAFQGVLCFYRSQFQDEKVPTLREAVVESMHHNLTIYFDVKGHANQVLLTAVTVALLPGYSPFFNRGEPRPAACDTQSCPGKLQLKAGTRLVQVLHSAPSETEQREFPAVLGGVTTSSSASNKGSVICITEGRWKWSTTNILYKLEWSFSLA